MPPRAPRAAPEVVLGLLGSTMGTAIAILFPSVMFIKNTSRGSLEKMAAQVGCSGLAGSGGYLGVRAGEWVGG